MSALSFEIKLVLCFGTNNCTPYLRNIPNRFALSNMPLKLTNIAKGFPSSKSLWNTASFLLYGGLLITASYFCVGSNVKKSFPSYMCEQITSCPPRSEHLHIFTVRFIKRTPNCLLLFYVRQYHFNSTFRCVPFICRIKGL